MHSAVMLEQASYCYLLSQPRMLHKYGFHLVLSGDHYKKCDQVPVVMQSFTFPFKGIPLALLSLRLEFWATMLSCCEIMNLHCQTIGLFPQIISLIKLGSVMLGCR